MYRELSEAAVKATRSKNKEAARKLVAQPNCPGPALYAAAHVLLGPGWEAWLLETAVHELMAEGMLEQHEDLVGALQAIASTGAPWWSYRALCATANAFGHRSVTDHAFIPPDPEDLAALVPEMTLVFGLASATDDEDYSPSYSDEVEAYVAACLAEHGFCCAPDGLEFCQPRLDKLCAQHTCERSKKTASGEDEAPVKDAPPSTNVQTHRYEEVKAYVTARLSRCLTALRTLSQP